MARRLPWRHFRVAWHDDERYLSLGAWAGLLFHRLHIFCDRHGRGSIPPVAGWMTARFPEKTTFEASIAELASAPLVILFVCAKNGVRCFEIVDYLVDAPAQLLRRNKTPSDWHRPPSPDNDGHCPPVTVSDGQRRTATDSDGQSAANEPQVPENTATQPARTREESRTGDQERREERGETRDLPIADTRQRSAANVPQPPDIPCRDGADAFAERWSDEPVTYPPGLSAPTVAWLAAIGEARHAVGIPWTGTSAEHLRESQAKLVDTFGAPLVDRAMTEHVRVGKALGQRGETPVRFLLALCEQEREQERQQEQPQSPWPKRKESEWERHTRLHGPVAQRRQEKTQEEADENDPTTEA